MARALPRLHRSCHLHRHQGQCHLEGHRCRGPMGRWDVRLRHQRARWYWTSRRHPNPCLPNLGYHRCRGPMGSVLPPGSKSIPGRCLRLRCCRHQGPLRPGHHRCHCQRRSIGGKAIPVPVCLDPKPIGTNHPHRDLYLYRHRPDHRSCIR